MGTQKPMIDLIPAILAHIESNQEFLQFNLRVFNVLEGQIKKEIEESLRREILSPSALNRCLQRIPPLNILQKTTDKLSKVYIEAPIRQTDSDSDKKIMDSIVKVSNLDNSLMQANRMLKAMNSCALEPFVEDGIQRVRVLPNHTFLPFSDDPSNPLRMTVFIKLLGSEQVVDYTTTDSGGTNKEETQQNIRVVDIYQLFSDEEILIIDSDGRVRRDKMQFMGIPSGRNPFGIIPQTYINSSHFRLIPFANQMGFDVSVLIPKLLTDLNYAVQFLSHSVMWVRNTDLAGVSINPDSLLNLGSGGGPGDIEGAPEIGTIDPTVDIEGQLQLIEFEFSAYMSSVGIKAATQGSMMPGREASGFAKAMDEGDATAVRKELAELFRHVEKDFWTKFKLVQSVWSQENVVTEAGKFSETFLESFSVKFAEMKILKTDKEKAEEVKIHRDLGLMSKRQAVKSLKPDFTDKQVDQWIEELESEAQADMDSMFAEAEKMQAIAPQPVVEEKVKK